MHHSKRDIELVSRIKVKDQKAFEDLYIAYVKFFMLTALRYVRVREDAEDLVQESFVKIYKDIHQFDHNRGPFMTWAKRVVINTCLQHLRKKSIVSFIDNILEFSNTNYQTAVAVEDLNLQDLTRHIQQLPKGYRTVFNMYVIDGYTHAEIADILRVSVSTSKTQLLKAKKLLRINIENLEQNFAAAYA